MDTLDHLLYIAVLTYLVVAPFTKVEESFNTQAMHDMLFHGTHLDRYDHVKFPGAVPRTFVGSAAVAAVARVVMLFRRFSKPQVQTLCRGVLGVANATALLRFKTAVQRTYGPRRGTVVGRWFVLMTLGQFHILYYASRPLPNMFAFPLVLYAYSALLLSNYARCVAVLAGTACVFRSELLLLCGSIALLLLYYRKLSLAQIVRAGAVGAAVGTALSVTVDSVFWQKWPSFPELDGFVFNVLHGNSSQWGVEPWGAYFSVHLRNLLANPFIYPLAILGYSFTPRNLQILGVASVLYIAIYSFQPHKELRFIIYVAPVFTALAARALDYFYVTQFRKSVVVRLFYVVVAASTFVFIAVAYLKAKVSALNYPGGYALRAFHIIYSITRRGSPCTVHMDVPACMTGVTRFGQLSPLITYDKTEEPELLAKLWDTFDFVITANRTMPAPWQQRMAVAAFSGINRQYPIELAKSLIAQPRKIVDLSFSQVWKNVVTTKPAMYIYEKVAS